MTKTLLFKLICCLAAVASATSARDKNVGQQQDKIRGKIHGNAVAAQVSAQYKVTRDVSSSLSNPSPSPTKFGFVPTRTASSYAAKAPRPSYFQQTYTVKDKREPSRYQYQYHGQQQLHEPPKYAVQEISQAADHPSQPLPYLQPELDTGEYSQHQTESAQQYYQQLDSSSQYQHQPPISRGYQQYETAVQYVTDNNIAQPNGQPYHDDGGAATPQYYYVQQQPELSFAGDSVVDPKGAVQYVSYVPASSSSLYSQNGISSDLKYQNFAEYQAPTTASKYSSTSAKKYPTGKIYSPVTSISYEKKPQYQYVTSSKVPSSYEKAPEYQYATNQNPSSYEKYKEYKVPATYEKAPEYQYTAYQNYHQQPKEIIIKRHPKSLLDSYIPSVVQLRWLEQQKHAKHYQSKNKSWPPKEKRRR